MELRDETLTQFVYLQILDSLTTVAFILNGVSEANPLIRWAMVEAPHPISGLLMVKAAGVMMAWYCVNRSMYRLMRKVNFFFALLVAYNLIALIAYSAGIR